MTREMLDDLLVDVPRQVVPDVDAAWETGARRRHQRFAARAAAVVAVGVLGAVAAARLDAPAPPTVSPAGKVVTVAGHPTTVSKPFFEPELSDRPGALAGTLQTEDGRWHLFDERGRAWYLPTAADAYPALSDDGTRLGVLRETSRYLGVYETIDLTTGEVITYDEVGTGNVISGEGDDQPYWSASQQPAYWSPDDARLLVPGGGSDDGIVDALLLENGEVTEVDVPGSSIGWAVGWASSSEIVWLDEEGTARMTDLEGTVLREVALQPGRALDGVDQWSGRVSPDGRSLALRDLGGQGGRLWTFSLADGTDRQGRPRGVGDVSLSSCPPMWTPDGVAVWRHISVAELPGGDPLIEISDRWGVRVCSVWAADALAGPVQDPPGVSEWRYWEIWYAWRPLLVGLGVVVVLVLALRRWRRRDRPSLDSTVDWWGGDAA